LGFYGVDTKNMDLPDLVRQVAASIRDHGTRALLLDFTSPGCACTAPTTRTCWT
jgi:hypothetical protein